MKHYKENLRLMSHNVLLSLTYRAHTSAAQHVTLTGTQIIWRFTLLNTNALRAVLDLNAVPIT